MAISKANFYKWLDGIVTSIVPGRRVFVYGNPEDHTTKLNGHYHHIREVELQDIEQKLSTICRQWMTQCLNAVPPLSAGRFMTVTKGIHFTVKMCAIFLTQDDV
jgi:hypothetical protein